MKSNPTTIAAAIALALCLLAPTFAFAQKRKKQDEPKPAAPTQKTGASERLEPDDASQTPQDVPQEVLANRRERMTEDADAEVPYYNNFLTSYRLGPEDVISVSVFGLDKYSRAGITVPPDGKIDYYFVPEGLRVTGKTTRQVAEEIAKHLDEYIIDPKVTVSLDKAMSARYGVLGDVARPGIMVMTRRLSVYEALAEAGGVLQTGDKHKVVVLHWSADRVLKPIPVDVAAIEKGKAADNYFLSPGDQIVVPGNRYKTFQKVMQLLPVLSFARIFTGGF
ncbi:MAG TPA: polysaccharide biosynthesis/export family protein [Pyrinomonadaceae bacterium]|jgi:polysaccharide export outer membrane protein|nr:polysaccharide biosynthesis/export family protein [Pyrinomonadaceae bacterium]